MNHNLLVQTSPCGEVWFEIWLTAHGKFFLALWKPNLKYQLSARWCLRLTPRPPSRRLCARFFCALWVKAHSARRGRGVNRKHHPAERCVLRFGFQSARKNFPCALSQISKHTFPQGDVCTIIHVVHFYAFSLFDMKCTCKSAMALQYIAMALQYIPIYQNLPEYL